MTITRDRIEAVLRTEDVEGFLKLRAPADEYSSEAGQIALALAAIPQNQLTRDKIIAVVALVRAKYFNLSSSDIKKRIPAFETIANALFISL